MLVFVKGISQGGHGVSHADLRYVFRRFARPGILQTAIAHVTNATLAVRQSHIWGDGTMACASDSRRFAA